MTDSQDPPSPLDARLLLTRCDPSQFRFETTKDLDSLDEMIGQTRAFDSMRFAADIRGKGFNVFALGPPGWANTPWCGRSRKPRRGTEPAGRLVLRKQLCRTAPPHRTCPHRRARMPTTHRYGRARR